MFANKFLQKSMRPLLSLRVPKRTFFQNGKNVDDTNSNPAEQADKSQDNTKDPIAIKLAEFTEDELKPSRISQKTIIKSIDPYKQHNPKIYERLSTEIDTLFREKDSIPSLKQEIKSLEEINKLNHEKLQTAVNRIKSAEQESLDIEARLSKEIEKSKTYAISKFSGEVLEILDNLELCMENASKNKEKNKELLESDFFEGVELTYKHALGLFRRYGIVPVEEGVGHKMDPNVHDVLFIARDESKPDGEIIHVAKRGYKLGDRILRASKVGVVRND